MAGGSDRWQGPFWPPWGPRPRTGFVALLPRSAGPLRGRGKEPQVCPKAGADFSGLVLSPEDGRRVFFNVSPATGAARGMARWRAHRDVSQTRGRTSHQTGSGRMEGDARGAERGAWRGRGRKWRGAAVSSPGQRSGLVRLALYKAPSSCHSCGWTECWEGR